MPIWRRRALMSNLRSIKSTPSKRMQQAVGSSSRLQQRSSVLLPEPDGPMMKTSSCGFTARSMPRSTSVWPKLLRRPLQIGEFKLRIVFDGPCDHGVAGDVGVGAADEHGLHRIGLRAVGLDLPTDFGLQIARPGIVSRALVQGDRLALEVLKSVDFRRALFDEEL